MNVKTYSFVKYIATFGALLLFLAPLLGFLQEWSYIQPSHFSQHFVFRSAGALAATLWVLEIVGIVVTIGYLYLRLRLKNKSPYTYTKKDDFKLQIAFLMYGVGIVFSFIYVIITCGIFSFPMLTAAVRDTDNHVTQDAFINNWGPTNSHSRAVGLMITFAPMYVIQFAAQVLASIFESWSRIQEQTFLNTQQKDRAQDVTVSKTGTKRTKEAQMLFDEEEQDKKSSKNKKKKTTSKSKKKEEVKGEAHIDDEQALEDFFNEDDDEDDKKGNK